jgi:hypothetical protein
VSASQRAKRKKKKLIMLSFDDRVEKDIFLEKTQIPSVLKKHGFDPKRGMCGLSFFNVSSNI